MVRSGESYIYPSTLTELAIAALQGAVKNSRKSDTILENSPKGDSQSNGAAGNAVRSTHVENVCGREVESSAGQQALAASVARDARRSRHHELQNCS